MTRVPSDPYAIQLIVTPLSRSAVKTIYPFACLFVSSNKPSARAFISPPGKRDESPRCRFQGYL